MSDIFSLSPLSILGKEGLKGKMCLLIARAGVGKTATLINMGLKVVFDGGRLIHISLEEAEPEKIRSYYEVILSEIIRLCDPESDLKEFKRQMEERRMIITYPKERFSIELLNRTLDDLKRHMGFSPLMLILEGMDLQSEGMDNLYRLKEIAIDYGSILWLSSRIDIVNMEEDSTKWLRGIMETDLFSYVFQLASSSDSLYLYVLKDRRGILRKRRQIELDPDTFLISS